MKKLINVLWAIEKDLHVIASNTEANYGSHRFNVSVTAANSGFNKEMNMVELIGTLNKLNSDETVSLKTATN